MQDMFGGLWWSSIYSRNVIMDNAYVYQHLHKLINEYMFLYDGNIHHSLFLSHIEELYNPRNVSPFVLLLHMKREGENDIFSDKIYLRIDENALILLDKNKFSFHKELSVIELNFPLDIVLYKDVFRNEKPQEEKEFNRFEYLDLD